MIYTVHIAELGDDVQLDFGEELHRHYQRQAARLGLTLEAFLYDLAVSLLIASVCSPQEAPRQKGGRWAS